MLYIVGVVAALCIAGAVVLFMIPSDEKLGGKVSQDHFHSAGAPGDFSERGFSATEGSEQIIKIPESISSPCSKGSGLYGMTPFEILFSFEGRIGRGQWWIYGFIMQVLIIVLFLFVMFSRALILMPIILIFSLWMALALNTKRWHDRAKSGWWTLIVFIPFIGQFWALIELGFLEGIAGDNFYGRREGSN